MSEFYVTGVIKQKIPLSQTSLTQGVNGSNTWVADVLTSSGESVRAIVKNLSSREVMVELICALIGKRMGLPIPNPMIVFDEDMNAHCFASQQLDYPDLAQKLASMSDEDKEILKNQLLNWKQLHRAAVFDAFIANFDRNEGNLLHEGESSFWLIDHGMAISNLIAVDAVNNNTFMGYVKLLMTNDVSAKREEKKLLSLIGKMHRDDVNFMSDDPTIDANMIQFLLDRLALLPEIVKKQTLRNHELLC
jgi:hypothetical protein